MRKWLAVTALVGLILLSATSTRGRGVLSTLVLDPGHGGSETGVTPPGGLAGEKELALELCRAVKKSLEGFPFLRVVITRTDDYALAPDERAARANHHRGDLFLSLHFHADPFPDGFFILYPRPKIAESPGENDWDVGKDRYLGLSLDFAEILAEELANATGTPCLGIISAGLRSFEGLRMPGVLLEVGSLGSIERARFLGSPRGRKELADGIHRAVARYRNLLEQGRTESETGEESEGPGTR